ncbi:glycosyltransferase [Clostridium manihotivorum]|uniref:Uncharacterized protein n=1 Tax=Clostridium manihotivorum TaxID=2320868 RepID=A0A3R5QSR6_9CLOT|nr:glycosyltransferase [Clostridium manihotivorum]QAA31668.1 hypothetical protein C1I91_08420 [Clostridium manihotivorum]
MKILHITYSWKPGRSGILNYVDNITKDQKKDNDVYIMYFYPDNNTNRSTYVEDGITFIVPEIIESPLFKDQPHKHYNNPNLEEKILDEVRKISPDIVHIQTCYGISTNIIPLIEESGFKTIVHIHDYFCFCPKQVLFIEETNSYCNEPGKHCSQCLNSKASNSEFIKRLHKNIENYNKATKIIAVSNFTKNIAVNLGLESNKISVVINGVSKSLLERGKRSSLKNHSSDKKLTFLHISPCSPMKGVVNIVQAFSDIKEVEDGNIELHIHGAKSIMTEKLTKLSKEMDSIKINPPYTYDELDAILGSADIAILPSLWWDTFPLTVFECMAYGMPVIGTKESGMSEAIVDGVDGFLINPHDLDEIKDVVTKLYYDNNLLDELKNNLRNSTLRTFDSVSRDVLRIYHEIV